MSGRRDESLFLDDMADAVGRLVELGAAVPDGYLGQDRALKRVSVRTSPSAGCPPPFTCGPANVTASGSAR
jgi:hypothetical protein